MLYFRFVTYVDVIHLSIAHLSIVAQNAKCYFSKGLKTPSRTSPSQMAFKNSNIQVTLTFWDSPHSVESVSI